MSGWVDLGGLEARTLLASRFRLDGGSMFGQVPKVLWSREAPADELNRIELVVRCLLLRAPGALVLVDAGMGGDYSAREMEQMQIDRDLLDLPRVLRSVGIEASAVTHVILTHLHFDHAAGLGCRQADGKLVPALPQARVFVQEAHWERARDPGPKERRSFRQRDLELIARYDLERLPGETEILPCVRVRLSEGHTHAQQLVSAVGTKQRLHYPADLIPTLAHIRAAYTLGFDLQPEMVIREKAALLAEAAADDAILVFEHDPRTAACRVREGKDGYVVREKVVI